MKLVTKPPKQVEVDKFSSWALQNKLSSWVLQNELPYYLSNSSLTIEEACATAKTKNLILLHITSNEVFNCGKYGQFIPESWYHDPKTERGRKETREELVIFNSLVPFLLIRVPTWFFGDCLPFTLPSLVAQIKHWKEGDDLIALYPDLVGTPTYLEDAAMIIKSLIDLECQGIYHVTNGDAASELTWGLFIADYLNKSKAVFPHPDQIKNPIHPGLDIQKLLKTINYGIPRWSNATERYLECLS